MFDTLINTMEKSGYGNISKIKFDKVKIFRYFHSMKMKTTNKIF